MIENVVMRGGAALTKDSATVLFSGWESSGEDKARVEAFWWARMELPQRRMHASRSCWAKGSEGK